VSDDFHIHRVDALGPKPRSRSWRSWRSGWGTYYTA
jgi:hypothetical protein